MKSKPIVFGTHDQATIKQIEEVALTAERAVLCADGHKGYFMPIGGTAAYINAVSVTGIGYDISCGNAAIRTNLSIDSVGEYSSALRNQLADTIFDQISFGIGRKNMSDDAPSSDSLFKDDRWDIIPAEFRERLRDKARIQLGTIGGGNHYVDVFADSESRIWIGVHFGSRGFGHTVASGFMSLCQGKSWGQRVPECPSILDLDTQIGKDYWDIMNLAGEYAYAGREWVARKVMRLLGGSEEELVHNHHNFGWKETHFGQELIVVRKGATPAFPGQKSFVGGSMGDCAVILEGVDCEESRQAMFTTVHGAGRVMSRTEAKGRNKWHKPGKPSAPGRISKEEMMKWVSDQQVTLRGGDVDESPQAYRRLTDVLTSQGGTVKILHTLKPLIVCMAPAEVQDPYKD
jgi:tRNA-splicing ligase RtcB